MSAANNNIPFEIQAEIIKRIGPVKSLIRFRSVSKQWKSLIESPEFITHHSVKHTHPDHLLLRYNIGYEYKYVSVADDDSFPQHKFSPVVSSTVSKLVGSTSMLDCSHGLVCLHGYARGNLTNTSRLAVLWNPLIRKSVSIVVSPVVTALGFVVCPENCDPKILTITRIIGPSQIQTIGWKAEVFTLSTGAWRSIPINMQLPLKELRFKDEQVVIDGVIYKVACDASTGLYDMVSFDSTSEEFAKVDLPFSLVHGNMSIYKLKESLAAVNCDEFEMICDIWMMIKNGDMKPSFAKQFTVSCETYDIVGFRKNGQLIREHVSEDDDDDSPTTLEVYEPYTQHSNDLGFVAPVESCFKMASYTESLLLLDHSQ